MSPVEGTVYIVDDDESVRRSLGRILSAHGVRVCALASCAEFLDQEELEFPACLLLDYHMPGMTGLELQKTLVERNLTLPVVFLSGQSDIPVSVTAMKRGAIDFLVKPVQAEQLLGAIESALCQSVEQSESNAERESIRACYELLSPREIEVLHQVIRGRLNKQIAFDLGIAEKTVKVHRARVMEKMQADSLASLVRMCLDSGIGDASPGEPG